MLETGLHDAEPAPTPPSRGTGKKNHLRSKHALYGTDGSQDAHAEPDALPAQPAPLVQAPGLEAQVGAQADDGGEVGHDQRAGGALAHVGELARQPASAFFALAAALSRAALACALA